MPDILTLLPKIRAEEEREERVHRGAEERQSFIELYGAGSVEALMEDYTPDVHNERWDAETQKPAPEIDVVLHNREAIAFMEAGKYGVYKHYKDNELRAYVAGRSRSIRERYFLDLTKYLVTLPTHEKK